MRWPWQRQETEKRAADPSWAHLAAGNGGFGSLPMATPAAAENLATVHACTSTISTALASLPAFVYRQTDLGRIEQPNHRIARLIRTGPNPHQSWPDFVECLSASVLLRGNGLARIERDGGGQIRALWFVPYGWATLDMLPTGRLRYDVTDAAGLWGRPGLRHVFLEHEILHLRHRSDDGLIGRSPLSRAAGVIQAGLAINEFASAMFANGVHPSGVVMADGLLSTEALDYLKRQFRDAFAGPGNAAKAMVLDQGLKWQSISVSPEDAELLASRRFSTEEIARIFNVPPPMIGDLTHGTFTNSETMLRWFAQGCLNHWTRKIEAEFTRSIFTDPALELELDLSGLLRGDPEVRWASHKIAVEAGILDANEVRQLEGWNPRPDGDAILDGNEK